MIHIVSSLVCVRVHIHVLQLFSDSVNCIGMKSSDELVQLEVLYSSRGRKIDELTKQLDLLQDDYEKKLRIAGHEKRQLQQQKELLQVQIQQKDDELQQMQTELNKTIDSLEATCTQASTLDTMHKEVSIYVCKWLLNPYVTCSFEINISDNYCMNILEFVKQAMTIIMYIYTFRCGGNCRQQRALMRL